MIPDKFSQRLISVLPDKCPQSQIPSFPKNKNQPERWTFISRRAAQEV
ncbi:pilin [Neisseria meningitidis]|nr:pilin [Neisseria meningitidis]